MILGAGNAQLNKQLEQVKHAFTDLSWNEIGRQILNKLLLIIVTALLFLIILWLGRLIINHLFLTATPATSSFSTPFFPKLAFP